MSARLLDVCDAVYDAAVKGVFLASSIIDGERERLLPIPEISKTEFEKWLVPVVLERQSWIDDATALLEVINGGLGDLEFKRVLNVAASTNLAIPEWMPHWSDDEKEMHERLSAKGITLAYADKEVPFRYSHFLEPAIDRLDFAQAMLRSFGFIEESFEAYYGEKNPYVDMFTTTYWKRLGSGAARIDEIVAELRREQGNVVQAIWSMPRADISSVVEIDKREGANVSPRFRNAYYALIWAESIYGGRMKLADAWEFLDGHREELAEHVSGYLLPTKNTFLDNVSKGCTAFGDNRKIKGQGVPTRSVIKSSGK